MTKLIRIDPTTDFDRVADLFDRSADYIMMETGSSPDDTYTSDALTGRPSHLGPEALHSYGVENEQGVLVGFIGCLQGHYGPDDWYIGLLLIDQAARSRGLGAWALSQVVAIAQEQQGRVVRIAVLEQNQAGRRFWQRQGFVDERFVPQNENADGHARYVMKRDLRSPCLETS